MQANVMIQVILFMILLSAAAYVDIKKREIPDGICVAIVLVSLLDFNPVHLLGVIAALPLLIVARIDSTGLGGGDIKLTAAAGLVLGFEKATIGLIVGLVIILVIHMILYLFRTTQSREAKPKGYPLAPFLMVGFISTYFI
ncbi:MAG: prepilin peptidase [Firmicutes bacterium HGW-Firmicutes-2]|nr:MAG: prepilin peptidase [Firmicutes bacterium HGW-Firmicutes-2]